MAMRRTRGQTRSHKQEASQAAAVAAVASVALSAETINGKRPTRSSVKLEAKEELFSEPLTRSGRPKSSKKELKKEPKKELKKELKKEVKKEKREPKKEVKKELKNASKKEVKATASSDDDEVEEEGDGVTEYERKRLENIQRNLDFMRSMGVSTAKAAARIAVGGAGVEGHAPVKSVQAKRKALEPALPRRKSRRIQGHQDDLVVLGDAGAEPARPTNVRTMDDATPLDERVRRFDATLAAEAVNLPGDKGAALLDSITGGLDERESDLVVDATGVATVEYTLDRKDVVKAVQERIYAVAFHPRADQLVVAAGDKRGNLALWRADAASDNDAVAMYRPHTSPVTQLHFAPRDSAKLLSASYDGSVREFDLAAAAFTELFGTQDNAGITSMAVARDESALLVSCDDGAVWTVDPRQAPTTQSQFLLHDKKVNTVHRHPSLPFCFATASLDRTVCLWDARTLGKRKTVPLVTMPHGRSVNCAYFSPDGAHLVTVGQDDFVNVFATADAQHYDAHTVAPTLAIPHNNATGRWLTKLHAAWDPKRADQFVIGCMQQPRRLQIFHATRKNPIQELTGVYFHSVHSINVFHPTLDAIAGGNSSGRLALWRGTPSTA